MRIRRPPILNQKGHIRVVLEANINPLCIALRSITVVYTPTHDIPLSCGDGEQENWRCRLVAKSAKLRQPNGVCRASSAAADMGALAVTIEPCSGSNVWQRTDSRANPTVAGHQQAHSIALGKRERFCSSGCSTELHGSISAIVSSFYKARRASVGSIRDACRAG